MRRPPEDIVFLRGSPRYVADALTRHRVGVDGRTAERDLHPRGNA